MKYLLCFALLLPTSLLAEDSKPSPCATVGIIAETHMAARQISARMSDVMEGLKPDSIYGRLIMGAYETDLEPRLNEQDKVIREFGNKWYMACVKGEFDPNDIIGK